MLSLIATWTAEYRDEVWNWFRSLSREEWLVVLAIVCICGFVCLLGLNSRRI